jgi:Protein of unknown function (DUF1761)
MDVQVNLWAVFAAMASSMVIGSIWYSPKVFGKIWMKLARIDTKKDRGSIAKPLGVTVVVCLITAYVLAHVAYLSNQFFHHSFLQDTLTTAFWMWLGFSAARFITHDAFEGRPHKLTLINVSNDLLTIMVMALVIGLLGY